MCQEVHLQIFFHQVISSSWVAGEISTILLPQHSVSDLLLDFPLLKNAFSNETRAFDGDRKGIQFV